MPYERPAVDNTRYRVSKRSEKIIGTSYKEKFFSPPTKSLDEDMLLIAWKSEAFEAESSKFLFLPTDCLRIFPILLRKAIFKPSKPRQ